MAVFVRTANAIRRHQTGRVLDDARALCPMSMAPTTKVSVFTRR